MRSTGCDMRMEGPDRRGPIWDDRSLERPQSESRMSQPENWGNGSGLVPPRGGPMAPKVAEEEELRLDRPRGDWGNGSYSPNKGSLSRLGDLDCIDQRASSASVELPSSADLMKCSIVNVRGKLLVSGRGRYLIPAELHGLAGNQSWWGLMRGGIPRADLIRVFLITDPRSGEASVLLSWEASSNPVVGDVALGGSVEPLLVHRSLGGEGGSVAERLEEALDAWVAKGLVEPGWRWSAEIWVTPVCGGVASIAEGLGAVQEQWHEVTLGVPIRSASGLMGLDPALGNVLACIASEIALPGDRWIKGVKRTVQWGGIVIGMTAGHPLVLNACAKSLIHDLVIEQASKQFGKLLVKSDRPWSHAPVAFDSKR